MLFRSLQRLLRPERPLARGLGQVSEALEKGEITSADRASAIDEELLLFAEALRDAEQ